MQRPPLPPKRPPFTYRCDVDPTGYFSFPRRYGETAPTLVQVYRDSTVVEVESPVQFAGRGRVLVRVASTAFDGLPETAHPCFFDHERRLLVGGRTRIRHLRAPKVSPHTRHPLTVGRCLGSAEQPNSPSRTLNQGTARAPPQATRRRRGAPARQRDPGDRVAAHPPLTET